MADIYMIFNDFNKQVYIGKALYGAAHRWREHIGYDLQNNQYIHRAMRKYGIEHFDYKIIETNIPKDLLNEREKYWIEYYNSLVPNGYNMTKGGDGGIGRRPLTQEEKDYNALMRQKGIVIGPEKNFENYKTTQKYQEDLKKKCQKVAMLDKTTEEVIQTFDSIKEAVAFLGKQSTARVGIYDCARGRNKTAYGYKWKYL